MNKALALCISLICAAKIGFASADCGVQEVSFHYPDFGELIVQDSVFEVEIQHMTRVIVDGREIEVPFGYQNEKWQEFKALFSDGDCIVYFITSPESWRAFRGSEGYLLVRDGEPIDFILIRLN